MPYIWNLGRWQRRFLKVLVYPREKVVTKDLQKEVRQPVFIVKDGKVQSRDLSSNCQARNNVNLCKSRRISRVRREERDKAGESTECSSLTSALETRLCLACDRRTEDQLENLWTSAWDAAKIESYPQDHTGC